MGRLTATRRSGLSGRPFLLFALLLCLPALGFGLLGWQSVTREHQIALREASAEAEKVLERRLDRVVAVLDGIAAREAERPYFHYQRQYAPESTVFQELDFQPSPLATSAEDALVLGWFQWELVARGVPELPETFGRLAEDLRQDISRGYGPTLRARLAAASETGDPSWRRVDHPLRVVQANEERGQLIEEVQIARQFQSGDGGGAPREAATTPYLDSFFARVGDEPVAVRYGAFRYAVASDAFYASTPAVAWRIVWIPAMYADRRETARDRWLLQGYAVDPGRLLPEAWETVGAVRLRRADRVEDSIEVRGTSHVGSLVVWLDAESIGSVTHEPAPDPSLLLVAIPDESAVEGTYADSRMRYLLLLAGVVVVVAVGFVVLTRGLRREIALVRRKEDFVAAVTHELKTPLAGIRMYADMLREGWVADEESADRYATRIIEESDRLGHLVDQVLDLAALERGVAKAQAERGDFGAAVRDAVALCEPRAQQAGVSLDLAIEEGLPLVTFDPKLLRPLVLNLVDNAIKYSEGTAEKAVRVEAGRDGPGGVLLTVADKGVGIDANMKRHIFEPFRRAGDEMTRSTKGVGIGLALVKRYAEAHRARIALESEAGKGTTVTVRFPL